MEYQGYLVEKTETKKVSEKFQKRTFVLTDRASAYPKFIEFQLTQNNCNLIDAIGLGSELKVTFSLNGRQWKSPQGEVKTFNTLDCFKILVIGQSLPADLTPDTNNDLPF